MRHSVRASAHGRKIKVIPPQLATRNRGFRIIISVAAGKSATIAKALLRSKPVHDNERGWLIQAQKGDAEAFTRLVEAYQRAVFDLCYRMLGNAEDAEDAAQETFLRAYKFMRRYDLNRPFSTWILSIAAHYCIDQARHRGFQVI